MTGTNESGGSLLKVAGPVDIPNGNKLMTFWTELRETYDTSTHCELVAHASMQASKVGVLVEVKSPPGNSCPQMIRNCPLEAW